MDPRVSHEFDCSDGLSGAEIHASPSRTEESRGANTGDEAPSWNSTERITGVCAEPDDTPDIDGETSAATARATAS